MNATPELHAFELRPYSMKLNSDRVLPPCGTRSRLSGGSSRRNVMHWIACTGNPASG
jgi:hypothetical protein